jgi:hypothetical protein
MVCDCLFAEYSTLPIVYENRFGCLLLPIERWNENESYHTRCTISIENVFGKFSNAPFSVESVIFIIYCITIHIFCFICSGIVWLIGVIWYISWVPYRAHRYLQDALHRKIRALCKYWGQTVSGKLNCDRIFRRLYLPIQTTRLLQRIVFQRF